ncbi:hypothetical protein CW357_00180 [Rummeliibacillus sp. TYF005]|nr:hypothetical protein D1606_09195 [Rummeliibacillus sp. POC4]RPJ97445.1 hypothetical protein CW357_00180 [Rummeliibacillus sp. TYF005]
MATPATKLAKRCRSTSFSDEEIEAKPAESAVWNGTQNCIKNPNKCEILNRISHYSSDFSLAKILLYQP